MYVVELINVVNDHGREIPKYLVNGSGGEYRVIEGVEGISWAAKYDDEQVATIVAQNLLGTLACTWVAVSVEDSLTRNLPGLFQIHEQRKGIQDDQRSRSKFYERLVESDFIQRRKR